MQKKDKIKNRSEFRKKFPSVYKWLIKNDPALIEEAFPKKTRVG